ncbi:MAG TPA: hypothetical protein VI138_07825 [Candidatus Dormibacteraeota bacterium]
MKLPAPTLEQRWIDVGGQRRSYRLALPQNLPAPLVICFHGLGIPVAAMERWTGLAARGLKAGFLVVYPEGAHEIWDDQGQGRRDGLDDGAFVAALVEGLRNEGLAGDELTLAGLSNGAFFAERLAREGVVQPRQLVLVAGTARALSRARTPVPQSSPAVMAILGTGDPYVPYFGGRPHGLTSWLARRRVRASLLTLPTREVAPAEEVLGDWAAVAQAQRDQGSMELPVEGRDPPARVTTWSRDSDPRVTLVTVEGGGHAWPGGPRYLPSLLIGRVALHLDATGMLLDWARGHPIGPG